MGGSREGSGEGGGEAPERGEEGEERAVECLLHHLQEHSSKLRHFTERPGANGEDSKSLESLEEVAPGACRLRLGGYKVRQEVMVARPV